MSGQQSFIGHGSNGEPTFTVGQHTNIPWPVFIPEVKWDEGFRAILNYPDALDNRNPIMVPAAAYQGLRNKPAIVNRENEEGEKVGEEEVEALEANHPLIYFDPPELYNFRRTSTLRKYYFKGKYSDAQQFKSHLRDGNYDDALELLPEFQSEFVKANFDRVTDEISEATPPRRTRYSNNSTDDVWSSIGKDDMNGYFKEIVEDASGRSSAIIPPVPLLGPRLESSLVTGHCTANKTMSEIAGNDSNTSSYYHICIKHAVLRTSSDAPATILDITRRELEEENYAGVAITIRNPHRLDAAGSLARAETFVKNLVETAEEFGLPVIAPRSEWLGSLLTDNGVAAFSDLMSSRWEYKQDYSGGPSEEWKKYGRMVTYGDAKRVLADPEDDDNESVVEYLEDGNLTEFDELPNSPPGDPSSDDTLKQKLGSPYDYRVDFAKPRKLSHVCEAQKFREDRRRGVANPAREYLKDSDNQYISI